MGNRAPLCSIIPCHFLLVDVPDFCGIVGDGRLTATRPGEEAFQGSIEAQEWEETIQRRQHTGNKKSDTEIQI